VVTKDRDFRDGHLLARVPRQLLVVATGNITNSDLLSLFELHLETIVAGFEEADFAELSQDALALGWRATHPVRAARAWEAIRQTATVVVERDSSLDLADPRALASPAAARIRCADQGRTSRRPEVSPPHRRCLNG
jgi:hypothetical protein